MFKKLLLTGGLILSLTTSVFARGDSVAQIPIDKLDDFGTTTTATGLDEIGVWDDSANKDKRYGLRRLMGTGIVSITPNATTFDIGTGTVFYVGSNTAATAITDVNGGHVGQIFTIVTVGGANWSTIADSGNFNIAGTGGFAPDSADDSISFLVQADNDYVQVFGTQTDN